MSEPFRPEASPTTLTLCEGGHADFPPDRRGVISADPTRVASKDKRHGRMREASRRARKLPLIEKVEAVLWDDALRKRAPVSLARLKWLEERA